ncbi:uncharacterized protein [Ptychodera flava]|uniref:uncharacterized protein isoform X2 n=1 Tax=Ptychodera flava TaxID=63121 RepID=UPI00396A7F7C
MSQNRGRNMTKGQGTGYRKNSRNLRYLNLSFGNGTDSSSFSSKSNGHRPHGGYKVMLKSRLSQVQVPKTSKSKKYLESVRNDCATKQEQEKLQQASSPQWVHGAASSRNHTGEFPLFTQQYLSSNKNEQMDASGGGLHIHRIHSPDNRSEGEYFRPNRMHQYLTATEMPNDSKRGVDIKLGRPTRTSLLRARHRSQSAPQLNSSHTDVRHLHLIGQISDSANKPKKQVLHRNLLPSTGPESLHQFLTGARYNRARWIDQRHSVSRSSSFRDAGVEDDPGYLPPYGSEASSSNSSTAGDMTPPKDKERETLPPAVNKGLSVPLTLKEINEIREVEAESKLKKELLPGKPKEAWDGAERGAGEGLYGAPTPNSSRETLTVDANAVLTPKRVTLQPPDDKTNTLSQHELKRHLGSEVTCVMCNNSHGDESAMKDHSGRGDAEEQQNSNRMVYEAVPSKYNMAITGTKLGLANPGRPKPAPRRVTFGDSNKLSARVNSSQYYAANNTEVEQPAQQGDETEKSKVEQPEKEGEKASLGDIERTNKDEETGGSEMPTVATTENDPVVSEATGLVNEDDGEYANAADNDGGDNKDDEVAGETDNVEVADDDGAAEIEKVDENEDVDVERHDDEKLDVNAAEGQDDRVEQPVENETALDTARTGSDQLDTQRSDMEETPRSEADTTGRISVSVVLKDKQGDDGDQIDNDDIGTGQVEQTSDMVEETSSEVKDTGEVTDEGNNNNNETDAVVEEGQVDETPPDVEEAENAK